MKRIHFVLAANNSSSQTRVTVEYANALARRGFDVAISVPHFDFFDFVLWRLNREKSLGRGRLHLCRQWFSWLILPAIRSLVLRRRWVGQTDHRLDPRIKVRRYAFRPGRGNMPDADVLIAFQCYLLPHLMYLHPSKGRVVGSIRLDYRAGTADPVEEVAEWREFCNAFYQRLNVPLFAVSRRAKESAAAMGISVETVIQNGINTEEFRDGGRRGAPRPLHVTLFTHDHPQKGQDFGCAALRRVRERLGEGAGVRFSSAGGSVKPEHRPLFDHHYGYLTGEAYVRMFQETDVFIFPSLYEGFPAVPLEAMACGCALAATLVSGVEEYAAHGKNAMLCLPGETDLLAENILALIGDVRLRDSLREEGIRTAESYSWEKATDRLLLFLEQGAGDDSQAVSAPFMGTGQWVPHKGLAS